MPRRPLSLALRLIGLIGLASGLVLLAFDWIIVRSIEAHFAELDADKLRIHAAAVAHILADAGPWQAELDPHIPGLQKLVTANHELFLQIRDQDGRLIHQTPGADLSGIAANTPPVLAINAENLQQWHDNDRTYRGAVLALEGPDGSPFTVVVATGIDIHMHYMEGFHQALTLTTLGAFAALLLAVWIAVYQGHTPLRRITAQIRTIRSDQLHIRLNPATLPEELVELARSFNEMLERIELVFQQLSHFSADIAHELRTPVTNLMTQTQVALGAARSSGEYREILYSNLEEYERMAQMIGDMLFLAQTDNGLLKPGKESVDLGHEIRELFDFLGAWAEERNVQLSLQGEASGPGDRLMLRQALSNLLTNAIRHTPAGGLVSVQLMTDDDHIQVTVENTGEAIPGEHLPRIFDRFYRVDPARHRSTEGAGLGLAIVKSIVEVHQGGISVSSTTGVTRFCMTLPR